MNRSGNFLWLQEKEMKLAQFCQKNKWNKTLYWKKNRKR